MKESYSRALALVLKHEGGYSNHPADPGGATMKGVIQRVYDGYRARKGLPARSVRRLEQGELEDIYRGLYWDKIDGDELPRGLDYCVFDAAVNSGVVQSGKWLQRALNQVGGAALVDDGIVGPATLAAADIADPLKVAARVCDLRLRMLKRLRTWPTFGKGWQRRVDDVRKTVLSWR